MHSASPEQTTCGTCGSKLPGDATNAHCPVCLLELSLELPSSTAKNAAGRRFAKYELIERIDQGSMGVVYKARDTVLHRVVAVKMLSPYASAVPGMCNRLRVEAETAAVLHHPNIVTVYEAGEHEGQPYFTMEFIDGINLARYLHIHGPHRNHLPWTDEWQENVAKLVARIARAVDYAHVHGVLHRDLKPANIMMDAEGNPNLTDFGLAKALDASSRGTGSDDILGTPSYMAPEVATSGAKRATIASDIYSLGIILYEMLAGRPPFRADSPVELLRTVIDRAPPHPTTFNSKVDRDLATICLKCIEKLPHRRYSSASALAEDLERWVRGEPIEARPVRPIEKVWRWCRREPHLAGMGALILTLVILAIGLLLLLYEVKDRGLFVENFNRLKQRNNFLFRIEREWRGVPLDQRKPIVLHPDEIALLSDHQPTIMEIPLAIGFRPSGMLQPHKLIDRLHTLNDYISQNVSLAPGTLTGLGIQLFPTELTLVDAIVRAQPDFVRADPGSFILAQRKSPHVTAILSELDVDGSNWTEIAIFVAADSGITDLQQLAGKSIAFGPDGTAVGTYLPQAALVDAGIRATHLQFTTNLQSTLAIHAVVRGVCSAGVALMEDIERLGKKAPLRVLAVLRAPNHVWVSTKTNNPAVDSFKASLLRLSDKAVMQSIDFRLAGFREVDKENLEKLASKMEKAALFHQKPPMAKP